MNEHYNGAKVNGPHLQSSLFFFTLPMFQRALLEFFVPPFTATHMQLLILSLRTFYTVCNQTPVNIYGGQCGVQCVARRYFNALGIEYILLGKSPCLSSQLVGEIQFVLCLQTCQPLAWMLYDEGIPILRLILNSSPSAPSDRSHKMQ